MVVRQLIETRLNRLRGYNFWQGSAVSLARAGIGYVLRLTDADYGWVWIRSVTRATVTDYGWVGIRYH